MEDNRTTERRAVSRQLGATIGPVLLRVSTGEVSARVQDISVVGAGLHAMEFIAPNTPFVLRPKRSTTTQIRGDIRHATQLEQGKWLLGCEFASRLVVDEILALGKL